MSRAGLHRNRLIIVGIALQSLVIVWLAGLHWSHHGLQQQTGAFNAEQLSQLIQAQAELSTRASTLESRLDACANDPRFAALSALQSQTDEHSQTLSSLHDELAGLRFLVETQISELENRIGQLQHQHNQAAQSKVAAQPARRPTASSNKVRQPPFSLVGLETRAGETFAALAPRGASRLDELRLIKTGEHFGDWRLLKIEPNGKAVFSIDGRIHTVGMHQQ